MLEGELIAIARVNSQTIIQMQCPASIHFARDFDDKDMQRYRFDYQESIRTTDSPSESPECLAEQVLDGGRTELIWWRETITRTFHT
jgi:hypothetical protein